ncbi:MAG: hypothetical protein ABIO44_01285, partial [Saprospiraceae bacterium]
MEKVDTSLNNSPIIKKSVQKFWIFLSLKNETNKANRFNPLYAIDFLLQAKVPANPSTSSNFYPHHGGDHVCGKNSPGAP